ncbi:MAG: NAD-dependent epimerase/dehydratase family protein [Alphaproteobacteria bacterium]
MTILVTGAAGFIGFHVAEALLQRGESVLGLDNLNAYYDVRLKESRLALLHNHERFRFQRLDIADRAAMESLEAAGVDRIVHLAAQAGVRHSLIDPYAYVQANLLGHLTVMELARRLPGFRHMVYASSSSVYGGNTKQPFSVEDRVDSPVSLYAATKRADELMSHSYSHLFAIPMTGLRFFTVYGPWGRPDMSAYIFTRRILAGEPLAVFNHGRMKRDFTYIDDIVAGVLACLDSPPAGGGPAGGDAPHRVYNIGNNRPEDLLHFIDLIARACGRPAKLEMKPMQPGDVAETYADIDAISRDVGFRPTTSIEDGIPRFVAWYREYHGGQP